MLSDDELRKQKIIFFTRVTLRHLHGNMNAEEEKRAEKWLVFGQGPSAAGGLSTDLERTRTHGAAVFTSGV